MVEEHDACMMGRVDLSPATCNASAYARTGACQLSKRAAHLPIHPPPQPLSSLQGTTYCFQKEKKSENKTNKQNENSPSLRVF